jgi:hypothetical protein
MLLVLRERPGGNEDVVQVDKAEVESLQNVIPEVLEGLGGISETEGHEGELE